MSSNSREIHERNQARGLKASINNPNVSEEAKQNAQQRLDEMGYYPEEDEGNSRTSTRSSGGSGAGNSGELDEIDERVSQGKEESRVIGGYKAVLKNPNVSEEAKEHAEQLLEKHDAL
ncbi:Conidiation protein 6-domain-containing protein [Panaeolus papilionaceus]|nr:Conidiation protein 6-domain-containing protein [Panaeolus papilionaceus]